MSNENSLEQAVLDNNQDHAPTKSGFPENLGPNKENFLSDHLLQTTEVTIGGRKIRIANWNMYRKQNPCGAFNGEGDPLSDEVDAVRKERILDQLVLDRPDIITLQEADLDDAHFIEKFSEYDVRHSPIPAREDAFAINENLVSLFKRETFEPPTEYLHETIKKSKKPAIGVHQCMLAHRVVFKDTPEEKKQDLDAAADKNENSFIIMNVHLQYSADPHDAETTLKMLHSISEDEPYEPVLVVGDRNVAFKQVGKPTALQAQVPIRYTGGVKSFDANIDGATLSRHGQPIEHLDMKHYHSETGTEMVPLSTYETPHRHKPFFTLQNDDLLEKVRLLMPPEFQAGHMLDIKTGGENIAFSIPGIDLSRSDQDMDTTRLKLLDSLGLTLEDITYSLNANNSDQDILANDETYPFDYQPAKIVILRVRLEQSLHLVGQNTLQNLSSIEASVKKLYATPFDMREGFDVHYIEHEKEDKNGNRISAEAQRNALGSGNYYVIESHAQMRNRPHTLRYYSNGGANDPKGVSVTEEINGSFAKLFGLNENVRKTHKSKEEMEGFQEVLRRQDLLFADKFKSEHFLILYAEQFKKILLDELAKERREKGEQYDSAKSFAAQHIQYLADMLAVMSNPEETKDQKFTALKKYEVQAIKLGMPGKEKGKALLHGLLVAGIAVGGSFGAVYLKMVLNSTAINWHSGQAIFTAVLHLFTDLVKQATLANVGVAVGAIAILGGAAFFAVKAKGLYDRPEPARSLLGAAKTVADGAPVGVADNEEAEVRSLLAAALPAPKK